MLDETTAADQARRIEAPREASGIYMVLQKTAIYYLYPEVAPAGWS